MSEYLEAVGRREEHKLQQARLVAECEALRDSLRRLLPLGEDVHALDREKILQTALALDQSICELGEIKKKLNVIGEFLGR